MDDPIKIIFKYKNNNHRIQYNQYIFIGNSLPKSIMSILDKIQDKQLYQTLILLSGEEHKKMNDYYGSQWIKKFFNTYHINYWFDQIRKNKKQESEIINKLGQEWYDDNIKVFELMDTKILYNYSTMIKEELLTKKEKKKQSKLVEEEEPDYTTLKKGGLAQLMQERLLSSASSGKVPETSSSSGDELEEDVEEKDELEGEEEDEREQEESEEDDQNHESTSNSDNDSEYNMAYPENLGESGYNLMTLLDKMAKYDYRALTNNNLIGGVNDDIAENFVEFEEEDIQGLERDDEDITPREMINIADKLADDNGDGVIEFDEGLPDDTILPGEELDMEDMDKIYQDADINTDPNISQTSQLIKDALADDKLFKKYEKESNLVPFDTSKDNLMYDDTLRNVYFKNYVTSQYLFKDDTIKTIKNKICASIKNNPKFGENAYIAPSRQYLWSEYFFEDALDKVMIGQKWIKRTDILTIDVEPNSNMRVYEELRGNLKLLRDNIRRYGGKIRREDDDFNILFDYEGYFMNNEIFMIDIYNELGKGYKPDPESLRNVIDVFIRVYFPRIKSDDVNFIIDYLNDLKGGQVEAEKIKSIYETLNNDLIVENEIMKNVENVRKENIYTSLFKEIYVVQSVIHVNLKLEDKTQKIDLFRIFNEFTMTHKYPFIQYQTLDGQIIFKYSEKDINDFTKVKENTGVLTKWFENAPYGISFKCRIVEKGIEKFMAINLSDTGRIEYKTQWKEEDKATIQDIQNTYEYVRELLVKVNGENKIKFKIPVDLEFKYAFINTMQQFNLPNNFLINHNDLSEFSRYFYPYVALVIEPRKRLAKTRRDVEKGKFGTYLRYKRVTKYENQAKIEQRVLYLMRNYDYTDTILISEISKQFNITVDRASEEIDRVVSKYPTIRKSRKTLKKLENIPKYKPPGIGIDIQGKQRDRYKIRISGARNKKQLDRIITFYNILIYLYVETYLFKKPERQVLKEKLKKLTKIASRRNKVEDIVNYDKEELTVKQMAKLDKTRIGFKPEKGQAQWTRACQNSGTDKKRRPRQDLSADNLVKQGFKLNRATGIYEKKTFLKTGKGNKKKKGKEIIIRAVGLDNIDDQGNASGTIYYSCSPEENAEHTYVGFLSKSTNPYGQCMPCCFKKDQFTAKNKAKKDYYMKCIGEPKEEKKKGKGKKGVEGELEEEKKEKSLGDKLYILQDTNKIQENKIGFLPKYLDFFLNKLLNKTRKIKSHYLLNSSTGYFFKYGADQTNNSFINAVSKALNMSLADIRDRLLHILDLDRSDNIFTALNNGDIRTSFQDRSNYIDYIRESTDISFDLSNHILSLPKVISNNGLNIIVFDKKSIIIKKTLEKERVRDDFVIQCQNKEEVDNLISKTRDNIILIKENRNYNPIIMVKREEKVNSDFTIQKVFHYVEEEKDNVIKHLYDFYKRNCLSEGNGQKEFEELVEGEINELEDNKKTVIAKKLFEQLTIIADKGNEDYRPRYQKIDARNKCKYIITQNNTILPVEPSGTIWNLQLLKNIEGKLKPVTETLKNLEEIVTLSDNAIQVLPIGLFYDIMDQANKTVRIIGIMTELKELAPTINESMSIAKAEKIGSLEYKQLFDIVDWEIEKGKDNYVVDKRILSVNEDKYENEAYELFRLHLSQYLHDPDNALVLNKINKIISSKNKETKAIKRSKIRMILYKITDKKIADIYARIQDQNQNQEQVGGKYNKLVHIITKLPDLSNYTIQNSREICTDNKSKSQCDENPHCHFAYDECHFALTQELLIKFINKVSDELTENDHKAAEILQKEGYFVSDIADYNNFKERPGQKIIKSANNTINKVLSELFGKENVPVIGKRRFTRVLATDLIELNTVLYPLIDMGDHYVQKIIDNNMSTLRAYANANSWLKYAYYDIESRNLGYYSDMQTDLANYFRSNIIDWLTDPSNYEQISNDLASYMDTSKKDYILYFIGRMGPTTSSNGLVEYYVLNQIYNIPILIYDGQNNVIIIVDGLIIKPTKEDLTDYQDYKNYINIRYTEATATLVPSQIDVLYFK
ncbi:MAG: early transcription factor VETF large subunit [Barrevirus sp.]|uniref:Early transcription factor VETF large subunit n=1 Tax=Barrevirus sp. TaxID=2487763 RepID=A0A3G4ZPN1_9VIRU|nr:MAG: early transcription factor VETF large subunit [Barrevirus sp.]